MASTHQNMVFFMAAVMLLPMFTPVRSCSDIMETVNRTMDIVELRQRLLDRREFMTLSILYNIYDYV